MATTALIAAKPFTTFANASASVTGLKNNTNSILFLHTSAAHSINNTQQIVALKEAHTNVMLLHAGDNMPQQLQQIKYDVAKDANQLLSLNNYKIVYRGAYKTGIINIDDNFSSITELNALAAYLKKEKDCNLVICLSSLGYKNKNKIDDCSIAEQSENIDMIIGGHAENFSKNAMIVLNKKNEEVIIDHAAKTAMQVGQVEICFNRKGQKNNIAI
jgi:5'-nucleotidase